jgi:hypothetical protein
MRISSTRPTAAEFDARLASPIKASRPSVACLQSRGGSIASIVEAACDRVCSLKIVTQSHAEAVNPTHAGSDGSAVWLSR